MTPLLAAMPLSVWDAVVFFGFLAFVVVVSLWASRNNRTSEDYFLAGRKLTWPLIGISLIASNISSEHFVGMTGAAFGEQGLAVAAWEWIAAIALVLVGWFMLPRFLSAGIYTIPQYLEFRYNPATRSIMATYMLIIYVIGLFAMTLYGGAVAIDALFDLSTSFADWFGLMPASEVLAREANGETIALMDQASWWATVAGIWLIGIIAGAYTAWGGLPAVIWTDFIQGITLLVGGTLVLWFAVTELGEGSFFEGWSAFTEHSHEKLHLIKDRDHEALPWTALLAGIWIPIIFYWGLNQFITQRALAAKSVAEGQRGVILAAALKLYLPLIVVIPGIIAWQMYADDKPEMGDKAYPFMIAEILPWWLRGILLAALAGAVMSTFNSGLNAASTIYTIDVHKRWFQPGISSRGELRVGRIATVFLVIFGCLWAPVISQFGGIFQYIQEVNLYVSAPILAVFVVGMIDPKMPPLSAVCGLIIGPVIYGICREGDVLVPAMSAFNEWSFLHHGLIVFLSVAAIMWIIRLAAPLPKRRAMPRSELDTRTPMDVWVCGVLVIVITAGLYVWLA
ncbi:MAG: sodium/solute symporter [Phycisphaerales bacterium]|nr:sodium/solute symporter [Phycisphaerales bacterium]